MIYCPNNSEGLLLPTRSDSRSGPSVLCPQVPRVQHWAGAPMDK